MGAGASSNLPNSLTAQDLRALVDDEQHFSGCLAVSPWLAVSLRNGGRAKKADVLRAWRRYTASIAFPELVEELGALQSTSVPSRTGASEDALRPFGYAGVRIPMREARKDSPPLPLYRQSKPLPRGSGSAS